MKRKGLELFGFTNSALIVDSGDQPSPNKKRKKEETLSSESQSHCNKTTRKHFNRKYDETYIKFGFTKTGNNVAPLPLCVVVERH